MNRLRLFKNVNDYNKLLNQDSLIQLNKYYVTGLNKLILDKPLGKGGAGIVYSVKGNDKLCCKIINPLNQFIKKYVPSFNEWELDKEEKILRDLFSNKSLRNDWENYKRSQIYSINKLDSLIDIPKVKNIMNIHLIHRKTIVVDWLSYDIYFIIQHRYEKTLKEYLEEKKLTYKDFLSLGYCLSSKLMSLHNIKDRNDQSLIHRDVKDKNIGVYKVNDTYFFDLIDFDSCCFNDDLSPHLNTFQVISDKYTPYDGYVNATTKSDVYSLGMVLLNCLYSQENTYPNITYTKLRTVDISSLQYPSLLKEQKDGKILWETIQNCLLEKPSMRICSREVYKVFKRLSDLELNKDTCSNEFTDLIMHIEKEGLEEELYYDSRIDTRMIINNGDSYNRFLYKKQTNTATIKKTDFTKLEQTRTKTCYEPDSNKTNNDRKLSKQQKTALLKTIVSSKNNDCNDKKTRSKSGFKKRAKQNSTPINWEDYFELNGILLFIMYIVKLIFSYKFNDSKISWVLSIVFAIMDIVITYKLAKGAKSLFKEWTSSGKYHIFNMITLMFFVGINIYYVFCRLAMSNYYIGYLNLFLIVECALYYIGISSPCLVSFEGDGIKDNICSWFVVFLYGIVYFVFTLMLKM